MANEFNMDAAKEMLDDGIAQAQSLIDDPSQIQDLLAQVSEFMKNLPSEATAALSNVPLMASMVKDYVTQEYTEVSPKVVATLVAAFLYLVKKKDLISDNIPVLGWADDLAVVALAMKLDEAELAAYKAWRDAQPVAPDAIEE